MSYFVLFIILTLFNSYFCSFLNGVLTCACVNRMSRRIKSIAKNFLAEKNKVRKEDALFQGSVASSSRHQELLRYIDPALQGCQIAFQRDEVTFKLI
jgi:hypothetical protein